MVDIFISYARENRPRIEPLAKSLENLGWSVFWDRTIPAGKTWRQVIGNALKNSRSVIVAWSQESIKSEWVQEEADRGRMRNILIPILIDDVIPPLGFGAIQAADLTNWNPAQSSPEFEKFIADISIILGPSPLKVRETEQKRSEEEQKRRQDEAESKRKAEEDKRRKERDQQERKAAEEKRRKEQELKQKADEERLKTEAEAKRKSQPEKTITNSIGMKFVLIPAGKLDTYGKSRKFAKPFYLQTTPLTQRQWSRVMGDNPSHFKAFGNDHPVENVSWYDAQKFIRKLNEMEKTKAYRLPTEDEWEYACRAGTKTRYSFGDDDSKLGEYAWYSENSGKGQEDHPLGTTHPVGKKKPNSWGLFDMHGNVLEWCQDWYGSKHEGRVVRGGNFHYIASTAMSAERGQLHPDKHYMGLGFRVAQNL